MTEIVFFLFGVMVGASVSGFLIWVKWGFEVHSRLQEVQRLRDETQKLLEEWKLYSGERGLSRFSGRNGQGRST